MHLSRKWRCCRCRTALNPAKVTWHSNRPYCGPCLKDMASPTIAHQVYSPNPLLKRQS